MIRQKKCLKYDIAHGIRGYPLCVNAPACIYLATPFSRI